MTRPGPPAAGFGNEVDLAFDWTLDANLGFSTVLASFEPTQGGRDFFGDGVTWLGFML